LERRSVFCDSSDERLVGFRDLWLRCRRRKSGLRSLHTNGFAGCAYGSERVAMDFLRQLFGPGDLMPHGYCYLWNPGLVWLRGKRWRIWGLTSCWPPTVKRPCACFRLTATRLTCCCWTWCLPKINEPEAYARISAKKEDVPVIFATGYSPEMALLHNAQERGLTILQKPDVPRDLARRVRENPDRQPTKVHPA